jgi:putative ABC transport system permease protein
MIRSVSPGYLRALGVDLIAGQWPEYRGGGEPTLLVNRAYARRFFGDRDPIGKTLRWGTVGSYRVVGVVDDFWLHVPESPDDQPGHAVFMLPRASDDAQEERPSFAVRVAGDPLSLVEDVRRIVRELDPAVAVDGVTTLDRVLAGLQTRPRFFTVILTIFGGIAAAIAAIGIYGVLAYGVTQRTREIGIRLALGAQRADVLRLVLWEASALIAIGTALGLVGAAWLTRYLAAMLFGLTPLDARTYAFVAIAFAGIAMLASYVPARCATRVNPVVALRFE